MKFQFSQLAQHRIVTRNSVIGFTAFLVGAILAYGVKASAGCYHQTWQKKSGTLLSGSYSTESCGELRRSISSIESNPSAFHTFAQADDVVLEPETVKLAIQD